MQCTLFELLVSIEMDCKPSEVDAALIAAHNAVAVLKRFVTQEEAIKFHEFRKSDGGRLRPDMPPPRFFREMIFDGLMQWVRSTVSDAQSGFIIPWNDTGDVPAASDKDTPTAQGTMSVLLAMMSEQMERERKSKEFCAATLHAFNQTLNGYREENRTLDAYRDRIIELQAVINHTKRYSEIDTEIGAASRPRLVPSDCIPSEEQRRREVANQLASTTMSMKEKLERVEADNAKLAADRLLIVSENKLLNDRVRVLEAQLAILNASSAVSLRELSKAREENARYHAATPPPGGLAVQPPSSPTLKTSSPRNVEINGVPIPREVAKWMLEVYKALLDNPEAADKLQALRMGSAASRTSPSEGTSAGSSRAAASHRPVARDSGSSSAEPRERLGSGQQRLGSARSFAEHVSAVRASSAGTTGTSQSDV